MQRLVRMQLRLFSVLKEAIGASVINVPADEVSSGLALQEWMIKTYPNAAEHVREARLARNQAYVSWDEPLAPGDELALITPVSGG